MYQRKAELGDQLWFMMGLRVIAEETHLLVIAGAAAGATCPQANRKRD